MIPQNFEYTAPASLDEALALLKGGEAKPLAGGMSLIPLMKLRFAAPGAVVDLGRIPSLNYIREDGGVIRIGPTTTHYQIETSPLLRGRCPLLAETAGCIGDVQVRNMGTIGGSAAHNDPAADYPAALLAIEAKLTLANTHGERTVPAGEFFVDTLTTALEADEIVREIVIPVEAAATGTAYQKLSHPASGFAVVGIAVRIRKNGDKIAMARIGVTGVANKAYRAVVVEKALEGTVPSQASIQSAAAEVTKGIEPNADLFASSEYRAHLARVHTVRAIQRALARTA